MQVITDFSLSLGIKVDIKLYVNIDEEAMDMKAPSILQEAK